MSDQLDSLRASIQAPVPPSSGRREEAKEGSSEPPDPSVNRGQARESIIAFLTLASMCQKLLIYQDQHKSDRLPGNMVIVHRDRCAGF